MRWVILIGAAPIWLPFLLTLWRDFNDALREEGGLLGSPPSPRELERIRRERGEKPDLLVNEPIVRPGERPQPGIAAHGASPPSGGARAARPDLPSRPASGFRDLGGSSAR